MTITVLDCDWGEAHLDNIQKLLEDVASHIVLELRDPFDETIHVINLPSEESPRTFFRETAMALTG